VRTRRLGGTEAWLRCRAIRSPCLHVPRAYLVGDGMVRAAGTVSRYCLNGRTSELVAAPVQAAELAALAARLLSARTVCGWPATGAWPAARGVGRAGTNSPALFGRMCNQLRCRDVFRSVFGDICDGARQRVGT